MFWKKEEPKVIPTPTAPTDAEIREEILLMKVQNATRKVAELELVIRQLLELVVMNIEHKDYTRFLMPKIAQLKNTLDKK